MMEKENTLKNFEKMIIDSWTYKKLTADEQIRLFDVFNSTQTTKALKGTYKQRWETLQAIYRSYLMALDYKPIGWREDPEVLF